MKNKWALLRLLAIALVAAILSFNMPAQVEAGFFSDWNKRPLRGGGYVQPMQMGRR